MRLFFDYNFLEDAQIKLTDPILEKTFRIHSNQNILCKKFKLKIKLRLNSKNFTTPNVQNI